MNGIWRDWKGSDGQDPQCPNVGGWVGKTRVMTLDRQAEEGQQSGEGWVEVRLSVQVQALDPGRAFLEDNELQTKPHARQAVWPRM